MSSWLVAARNLSRHRRRTHLTLLVVAFGFAALTLAFGFAAQSLEALREGTIRSGTGHVQVAARGGFETEDGTTLDRGLADAPRIEAVLAQDTRVAQVLPRLDFVGLLSDGKRSMPFLGTGLDPAGEARFMEVPRAVSSGRWLASRGERAVVLGGGLARSLGARVGDTLTLLAATGDGTLNAVDGEVAGIVTLPIRELDDRYLATTLDLATELLDAGDRVSKLVVVLRRDPPRPEAEAVRLRALLEEKGFPVETRSWRQLAPFYRQVRILYFGIFGFMGAVLAVVVLLASANTMVMAAAERTREIGTLRALGTRPGLIRRLFVCEGVLLALAGSACGALLALGVRFLLNHSGWTLPPPPGATGVVPLHLKAYGWTFATGALVMLVTLAFASWLPARKAASMPIVEALAHV
jgi:putative ABC transport system permease protein